MMQDVAERTSIFEHKCWTVNENLIIFHLDYFAPRDRSTSCSSFFFYLKSFLLTTFISNKLLISKSFPTSFYKASLLSN